MLNRAYQAAEAPTPAVLDEAGDRHDLERAAAALVQLEAWTRQRGLGGLASKIEAAVDHADAILTRGGA